MPFVYLCGKLLRVSKVKEKKKANTDTDRTDLIVFFSPTPQTNNSNLTLLWRWMHGACSWIIIIVHVTLIQLPKSGGVFFLVCFGEKEKEA